MKHLWLVLWLAACDTSDSARSASPTSGPSASGASASGAPASPASAASSAVNVAAAKAAVASGAVVIDVRSPEEWEGGHADNATSIPVESIGSRLTDVAGLVKNDKSKPIVVVCRSGGRAAKAHEQLTAAGYTHVINGGAWQNVK